MAVEDSLDIFGSDPFGRDYLYGLSTGREGLGLQPPPQGLQLDTRPYDQMQATPRGFTSGLFSDVFGRTLNMPSMPRTGIPAIDLLSPNMNLLNRLSFGDLQKTAERVSYGEPLSTGSGMTLRPKDETVGAALTVAPFAPVAGRVAGRMIKATEGMPVGMGIKDVGKGITSNISQFTGFKNTTPYGKAKEVAAYLDRLNIPYTINKSKTTNSAYLEIQTGKGDFDYPMQFRFSDHSTDLPHQNRQIFTNPKPDPNFDLDVFKDGGHDAEFAVNKINELATKVKPQPVSQRSLYPQQAALDLAQQRAALPVEQGGLGLPSTNTAADRAKAMGFDVETSYIHSTSNPFTKINEDGKFSGIFTLPNYSANYGTLNMPLVARGEIATSDDLRRLVKKPTKKMQMAIDERIPDNVDIADATVEMQKLRNELARKYGFSSVKVSDEFGQDTTALVNPANIRSRFAAFDPFRKDVATATAMGVALPDLLAQPVNQYQNPYETLPMYTDPFGNTIGSSIR